jgi:hypothetical protein
MLTRLHACTLTTVLCIAAIFPGCIPSEDYYKLKPPSSTNHSLKYIFYLHSKIIETKGPFAKSKRYGPVDYYGILASLEKRGFTVVSEIRPPNTLSYKYARKVVDQIDQLLAAGVLPENITVAGLLKGGIISFYVSAILKNPKINFVILSGCGTGRNQKTFYNVFEQTNASLKGNFLSIIDSASASSGTCKQIFGLAEYGINSKEIPVFSGLGTGLFYSTANQWMNPMVDWIYEEKEDRRKKSGDRLQEKGDNGQNTGAKSQEPEVRTPDSEDQEHEPEVRVIRAKMYKRYSDT